MVFLIDDLAFQLLEYIFYFQIVLTLVGAGLIFLAVRKGVVQLKIGVENEMGAIFGILAAYFIWVNIFATLVLTIGTVIIFYFFGGIIISVATFLATILK